MTMDKRLTPSELVRIFARVQTERLILRRPRATDGSAMFRVHGDPETYRYTPVDPDPDLATSEATLRRWLDQWDEEGYGYWAVALQQTQDEVIGFGGVRRFVWRERDIANLYYRLTPAVWGNGYAAEVAQAAVQFARAHLSHLPVVARIRAANIPSLRTAERSGLLRRPDLDEDEHLIFALGW
jgi:RimJ/RimL family protein N-acetyltransferase